MFDLAVTGWQKSLNSNLKNYKIFLNSKDSLTS
jgi:hypothetical protein